MKENGTHTERERRGEERRGEKRQRARARARSLLWEVTGVWSPTELLTWIVAYNSLCNSHFVKISASLFLLWDVKDAFSFGVSLTEPFLFLHFMTTAFEKAGRINSRSSLCSDVKGRGERVACFPTDVKADLDEPCGSREGLLTHSPLHKMTTLKNTKL